MGQAYSKVQPSCKSFFLMEISLFLGGGTMEGGEQDRGQEARLHDEQESIVSESEAQQRRHGSKISRTGHFFVFYEDQPGSNGSTYLAGGRHHGGQKNRNARSSRGNV